MFDSSIHLAPNAPWLILALATLAGAGLAVWAYRFAVPRIPGLARGLLTALRLLALVGLIWLLAQPVLERVTRAGARLVVLVDRSRSMSLPASPGGPTRAAAAADAVGRLRRAWRGRAEVVERGFAAGLEADSALRVRDQRTALGDAIDALAASPEAGDIGGIVVVSDGAFNAGEDPVAAVRRFGVPAHGVLIGDAGGADRAVSGIEASTEAQVGRVTTVRVRVVATDERGAALMVRLLDGDRELGRSRVVAPGGGAEVAAEFPVTPSRPGLAVWTAVLDSAAGEVSTANNARQVAVQVAPGRLGVLIVSRGLNWDLAFIRRALEGDSSLSVSTWTRERAGWRSLEGGRGAGPGAADLGGKAVVVLDAMNPAEVSPAFDQALSDWVRRGGAVLALGGSSPGLARYRSGTLGRDLALVEAGMVPPRAAPQPAPEAQELLGWDDDPARGERAWRAAAPLSDLAPIENGAGDRVLVRSSGPGPALLFVRRVGRGQALLVNGAGLWRWSLSGHDDLTAERGRTLWRRLTRWLAEPVQGEPLRVRPERWLTSSGDAVRLFATLQDDQFRPVAGATVEGDLTDAAGRARRVRFEPRAAGAYEATLEDLPPGRYRVSASAQKGGTSLGRAASELAVDRWNLEEASTLPDSAALGAVAGASRGHVTNVAGLDAWARSYEPRSLARGRSRSTRLWESPWVFGLIIGALSLEWAWRRKRGLP